MTRWTLDSSLLFSSFLWAVPSGASSGLTLPPTGTKIIPCPQFFMTGVPPEKALEGWANGGYGSANFNHHEVHQKII